MDERRIGPGDGACGSDALDDLAHDLRSPLTVAVGRVQLIRRRLRRDPCDAASIDSDLEAVEAALVRLWALTDRLDGTSNGAG